MQQIPIASHIDTGLISLCLIARLHGQPCEPEQLRHEFAVTGAFTEAQLLRAAKFLQLKARSIDSAWERLQSTTLPALARQRDGHYAVIVKIDPEKILVQDPREPQPQVLSREVFSEQWSGCLILITKRTLLPGMSGKFDLSWFIPSVVRHRKLLGEVLLVSLVLQILGLVSPLFFQTVIDKVLTHRGLSTLDVLCVGLLIISVFEVVLTLIRTYLFSHTTNRIDVELGVKLYRHLMGLPISYFLARPTGTIVARVHELDSIRNFLTGSALTLVLDVLFSVVFLALMYTYSTTLFFIVLLTLPAYILLSVLTMPLFRQRLNEKFQRGAENQAFLTESVTAAETIKSMALEPQMRRRWEDQLAGYVGASFRAGNLGNVSSQAAQLINKISMLCLLWVGAREVMANTLTVGELIAFNMFAGRVSGPILRLVQLWQDFQQAGISIERLGDILNMHTEPGYNPNRATLPAIRGDICFQDVVFRYQPQGQPVLRGVSLHIQPGEIVGIIGRSGSGKSTLAKLVQRLYVPESGRITVDGVDLTMVEPAWLRRQIGVVPQTSGLFNRSVRENIAITDPTLSMEQVIDAAKLAGAHDFILELPEGYDTVLAEQGASLSGGQRQRIAVARALINNPKILIFDEATSALDLESEQIIAENMQHICRGRTTLIIAHRPSTLSMATRIVRMDKGALTESSHAEVQGQFSFAPGQYASTDHANTSNPTQAQTA